MLFHCYMKGTTWNWPVCLHWLYAVEAPSHSLNAVCSPLHEGTTWNWPVCLHWLYAVEAPSHSLNAVCSLLHEGYYMKLTCMFTLALCCRRTFTQSKCCLFTATCRVLHSPLFKASITAPFFISNSITSLWFLNRDAQKNLVVMVYA